MRAISQTLCRLQRGSRGAPAQGCIHRARAGTPSLSMTQDPIKLVLVGDVHGDWDEDRCAQELMHGGTDCHWLLLFICACMQQMKHIGT